MKEKIGGQICYITHFDGEEITPVLAKYGVFTNSSLIEVIMYLIDKFATTSNDKKLFCCILMERIMEYLDE